MAPGILPANVRRCNSISCADQHGHAFGNAIPASHADAHSNSFPLPHQQSVPPTPDCDSSPTNTPLPIVTETLMLTPTATDCCTSPPAALSVTPVGGGSGQIAYASDRTGLPQIYLVDLASLALVQITNMPEGACQPAWSPDGKKLVFISPCKGMDEIYYGAGLYID